MENTVGVVQVCPEPQVESNDPAKNQNERAALSASLKASGNVVVLGAQGRGRPVVSRRDL